MYKAPKRCNFKFGFKIRFCNSSGCWYGHKSNLQRTKLQRNPKVGIATPKKKQRRQAKLAVNPSFFYEDLKMLILKNKKASMFLCLNHYFRLFNFFIDSQSGSQFLKRIHRKNLRFTCCCLCRPENRFLD